MGTLNPKLITPETGQALDSAGEIMHQLEQSILTPETLLLALVRRDNTAAHPLLSYIANERGWQLAELEATVETMAQTRTGRDMQFFFSGEAGDRISLSNELIKILDEGLSIAQANNESQAGSDHILAAMAQHGTTTSGVMRRFGMSSRSIQDAIRRMMERDGLADYVSMVREGKLEPVFPREELLQELDSLLSLAHDRHTILIGPAGVGKQSLALALAFQIARDQRPAHLASIHKISESFLLEKQTKALQVGLQAAKGGVLFIPHIHRFFGNRLEAEFFQAGGELRKALLNSEVTILGSTDQDAFDRLMKRDTIVSEHTQQLQVPPASLAETESIVRTHQGNLEHEYGLQIDPAAIKTVAEMAQRYLSTLPQPGAAMQLVHRTAASLRSLRTDQDQLLDSEDVTLTVSQMTGIPVNKLGTDERTRYARMVEHLHKRIIGQEEAVMAVSRAVKTARVGLKDPKRPIGSFLFLGPTGVGKTELAKALAEFMFGDEDAAIELDMSEYQQEHSVNRLIGAPPGYVGYEGGGQLTDAVRGKPYSVVLFDEVEKAHRRVADILLQVMEEGRLTDGQGRTTLFNESIIILTSNLGSELLTEPIIGERQRQLVMDEVKLHYRPEFLNRLDDIVLFHPLSQDQLGQILELLLKKELKLAAGSGITLSVTQAAKKWLLEQNTHPEWGARPLRRILRRYLREPLADSLLQIQADSSTTVLVDAELHTGLIFRTLDNANPS